MTSVQKPNTLDIDKVDLTQIQRYPRAPVPEFGFHLTNVLGSEFTA